MEGEEIPVLDLDGFFEARLYDFKYSPERALEVRNKVLFSMALSANSLMNHKSWNIILRTFRLHDPLLGAPFRQPVPDSAVPKLTPLDDLALQARTDWENLMLETWYDTHGADYLRDVQDEDSDLDGQMGALPKEIVV